MANSRIENAEWTVCWKVSGKLDYLPRNKIRQEFGRVGRSASLVIGDKTITL